MTLTYMYFLCCRRGVDRLVPCVIVCITLGGVWRYSDMILPIEQTPHEQRLPYSVPDFTTVDGKPFRCPAPRRGRLPRVFCYTIAAWPPPGTLTYLVESMKVSCDGFRVYGPRDDPNFYMRRLYEAAAWQRHFETSFRELMETVWMDLLGTNAPKYDFYLKVWRVRVRVRVYLKVEPDS